MEREWGTLARFLEVSPYETREAVRSAIRRGVLVEGRDWVRQGGRRRFRLTVVPAVGDKAKAPSVGTITRKQKGRAYYAETTLEAARKEVEGLLR